jgi:RNA polymerase sigma-70 factor (ECF subfamily)
MTPPQDPALTVDALLGRRQWLRGLAHAMARDDASADDLEQDAWMAALQKPPRSESGVKAWFRSVVRHRLVQNARSGDRRRRREEAVAVPEAQPSAEDIVARAEAHRLVVLAVFELEEPLRATVLLRYFEDLPPEVIGQRMGVPGNTVRARLRRALERLRQALAPRREGEAPVWALILASPGAAFGPEGALPAGASPTVSGTAASSVPVAIGGALLSAGKSMPVIAATVALAALGLFLLRRGGGGDGGRASGPESASRSTAGDAPGGHHGLEVAGARDGAPAEGEEDASVVPAGDASIHGELLLAGEGKPAVDVEVRLVAANGASRRVRTGTGGLFSFDSLATGGPFAVEAGGTPLATTRRAGLFLAAGERRHLEPLLLGAPVRVRVQVVGPTAEPVPGAKVKAFVGRTELAVQDWSGRGEAAVASLVTDEAGVAEFRELAPGTWTFRAEGEGFASSGVASRPLLRGGASLELVMVLEQGSPLQGTVHAPDGSPLAGIAVLALTPREGQASVEPMPADPLCEEVVTDARGRYRFPALRRGTRSIAVSLGKGLPARIGIVEIPAIAEFDIHLDGGTLSGRVTAEGSGAPVEGARVRVAVWRRHHPTWLAGFSDSEGRYSIEVPLAGAVHSPSDADGVQQQRSVNLTVEKEGWVLAPGARPTYGSGSIIAHAQPLEWNFTLRRGASLSGVVRGPDGPVPGAAVTAEVWNAVGGATSALTATDEAGRYRFAALPEGTARLMVEKAGLCQQAAPGRGWTTDALPDGAATVAVPREGAATLDVAMITGTALEGVVRSTAGPVAGALIKAAPADGPARETSTDGDGRFRVEGLRSGTEVALEFSREGYSTATRTARAPAEAGEPLSVELAPSGSVSGLVLGPDGTAVPGAMVQVAPARAALEERYEIVGVWQEAPRVPVDSEGRFRISLPPLSEEALQGGVVLRASARGFAPVLSGGLRVPAGDVLEGVVLDLRKGATLVGRVEQRLDGAPVAGAMIEIANQDLPPELGQGRDWSAVGLHNHPFEFVAVSGADGRFEVHDLPPFHYTLRVQPRNHAGQLVEVDVPSEKPLTVQVDPLVTLSGTVVYEDGTPAAGAQILARTEPGDQGVAVCVAGADGAFRFSHIYPGRYRLEGGPPATRSVDVRRTVGEPVEAPGEGVRLVVTRGAGLIEGRCVAPDGAGIPRAQVFAKPVTGGTVLRVTAAVDGSFTLAGLEPGAYTLGGTASRAAGGPETLGKGLAAELASVDVGVKGVELRFEIARALAGKVALADGTAPKTPIVVQARRGKDSLWVRMAGVGPDGAFSLPGLPPGAYLLSTVHANTGQQVEGSQTVEAEAGTTNLRLTL